MKTIAIVEDESEAASKLEEYINKLKAQFNEEYNVVWFNNPNIFLQKYNFQYDLIFMDIIMPNNNGMDVAKKIRRIDNKVLIVFVTNMAKYAIKGYEVNAFDFIVKPLNYTDFKIKFNRIRKLWTKPDENKIIIRTNNSSILVSESDIKYIEIFSHKLIYHTVYGEICSYGTLTKALEELPPKKFIRCNRCYVVNLGFCSYVKEGIIKIEDEEIPIALKKRKEFKESMASYYQGKE